jgi:hypothetical protein
LNCDVCGASVALERSKEALIRTANNSFHLYDLCSACLDTELKRAATVNDTEGFRHKAAALITPKDGQLPQRKTSEATTTP